MFLLTIWLGMACAHAEGPRYSILQGTTSETVTHFNVLVRADEDVSFDADGQAPTLSERIAHPGSPWLVYKLRFEGLSPGRTYKLSVYDRGQLKDERHFRTLAAGGRSGKLAFGSCMMRQLHNPFMWNAVEAEKPDVLLLLGDAVYLDRENLISPRPPANSLEVWTSFAESRNTLNLYFWKELRPVISVWDDHDSGGDNVDPVNFPLMRQIRSVYDAHFANEPIDRVVEQGPGMAKSFDFAGRRVIMLDGRSFRNLDPRSPMFGREQEEWLMSQIRPGMNFLFNGSQFYGKYIEKDSFEYNWPVEFAAFIERLRRIGAERGATLVFGSGDIHFSEVQRISAGELGYETLEITSSSIHSFGFPGHYHLKPDNPRRTHATGTHNLLILDMDKTETNAFVARSLGWRGNDLFTVRARINTQSCAVRLKPTGS